jgi:uncharacterized protein with von Willebrand factor type A (vWA) domain
LGAFVDEMKERGYIREDDEQQQIVITRKTERSLRQRSLEEIFKDLKKGSAGGHKTNYTGTGRERQPETRPWQQGDDISNIDSVGTMMNMLKHSSIDQVNLHEDDLRVHDTDHYSSAATVLLIDLSHSMILYGEDRITPAKKVAMALSVGRRLALLCIAGGYRQEKAVETASDSPNEALRPVGVIRDGF